MTDINLGPLEQLLEDADVTEIMVNGTSNIYVEKHGEIIATDYAFEDEDAMIAVINQIIAPLGRHVSIESPIADVRLADGSRVTAVLPPIAITGPAMTIRKYHKGTLSVGQLIQFGSWTQKIVDFIESCIRANLNIIISGNTSSGKTTIMNTISKFIPDSQRVVTVEETAEIQLQHEHVVRLEARPSAPDGTGEISMGTLLNIATRMRPDRIVAGEMNGNGTWEMLQLMSTGYDGSMFTIHATDINDALNRIEMQCAASTTIPILQIRSQIAQAVHLMIQQNRLADGKRKITEISEIVGISNNIIDKRPIMQFVVKSETPELIDGEARFTGYVPTFAQQLNLPEGFFTE